jgi:hypothetical protein
MWRRLPGGLVAAVLLLSLPLIQAARQATAAGHVWYQDRQFIASAVICALVLLLAGLRPWTPGSGLFGKTALAIIAVGVVALGGTLATILL